MSSTFTFRPKEPPPAPLPAPTETLTPPSHHPRVAGWLAVGALALALALDIVIVMLAPAWAWAHLGLLAGGSLCVFLLAFGVLVVVWQWRMVERPYQADKQLLEKQIETLQAEIESLQANLPADPNKGLEYQVYLYRLVFKAMLKQDTTRPARQQTEHGKALEMLRLLGLYAGEGKGAHFTTTDPFRLAHLALKIGEVSQERFWIVQPNGRQSSSYLFKK